MFSTVQSPEIAGAQAPGGARLRRVARLVFFVVLLLASGLPPLAAQPPPTTAAQDGFVPVEDLPPEDRLPAAPLLVAAYAAAWAAIFVYIWSLWRRLSRVEHEMAALSRRVDPGARR